MTLGSFKLGLIRWMDRWIYRQIDRQIDRQTDRYIYRQIDRQIDMDQGHLLSQGETSAYKDHLYPSLCHNNQQKLPIQTHTLLELSKSTILHTLL